MLRIRSMRAALLLVAVGCASPRSASRGVPLLEGIYVAGPEANWFRECSGTLKWTVEFVPGAEPATWPRGTAGGYNAAYYFVRWQADLILPPRVPLGKPPAGPLLARVHAVTAVRALRPGECGERP